MINVASRTHHAQRAAAPSLPGRVAFLCVLLGQTAFGFQAAAQPTGNTPRALSPLPRRAAIPLDDSAYVGVATTSTITQRFEIYNPHSMQELRAVKDMGFTQVILDFPNLHPAAAAIGLDVVSANWWTHETPAAEIDGALAVAKQIERSRLAGISMMDEPGRNSPETPADYYVELYNRLRPWLDRELPGVPLEISHWGPLASWSEIDYYLVAPLYKSADVMRIMPYPDLNEGPLSDVYFMMQRSRSLMANVDRDLPLLVILQAWTLPPKSELPTIAELRVMAYQAMLGGATTLSFYHYRPEEWARRPDFHDAFAELMKELTRLSRRCAGASIESTMTHTGILQAIVTWPSNETIRIRINTNRNAAEGLAGLAVEEVTLRSSPGLATWQDNASRTGCGGYFQSCRPRLRAKHSRGLRARIRQ